MSYVREVSLVAAMTAALPELSKLAGLAVEYKMQTTNSGSSAEGTYVSVQTAERPSRIVARFCLLDMPGCCGVCISTGAHTHYDFQHRGIGTLLNKLRQKIARESGYGVLLCTDVQDNPYQRRVLAKTGWKDVHQFVNPRSGNRVNVSVMNLRPEVTAEDE